MNTVEIPDIGYTVEVPKTFDEMTRSQVLFTMKLLHNLQTGAISFAEFRVRMLYKFVGIKRTSSCIAWERLHPEAAQERNEKIVILYEQLFDFLFNIADDETIIPQYDCLTNHLPKINGLHGPDDGLLDISFAEFRAAASELQLYLATKDDAHIDRLIACLYRPKGKMQPSGRNVKPFDIAKIDKYAPICSKIAPWKKQLILLWYSSCVNYIQTGEFTIDGRAISFAGLFLTTVPDAENSQPSLGWLSVLYDLAEKQTFGDIKQTDQTNIIDVLTLLYNYKQQSDYVRKSSKAD